MKFLLSLLLSATITGNTPVWINDFNAAKVEAVKSDKLILVNFSGSDWCGPCIRLHKEIFDADAFVALANKNLVLVNADFPRFKKHELPAEQQKLNEALADKYNPQGKFPYTLLIDTKGNVLKSWDGYPDESPEAFVSEVNAVVNAHH